MCENCLLFGGACGLKRDGKPLVRCDEQDKTEVQTDGDA
jgi:hypothetical protein